MKLVKRAPEGEPSDEAANPLETTHLYALERDRVQIDDFYGRGGAIASMCDDLLVVSPWGEVSVVDRHGQVEYLEGKVPMNMEGLESHPSFGRARYYRASYFRVADILITRRSKERWELFVTHHYFTEECILFRLSSTILFGRRPVSMSQPWRTIWDAEPCRPAAASAGHQAGGSMLADGPDDLLIVVGDHDWTVDGVAASQRPDSHYGKLVRVNIESGEAEIVATGLRNPQGLALDMDGNLWATEHGPLGGDELNLLEPGGNYGWNQATYGVQYGGRINVQDKRKLGRHEGFEHPVFAWVPSIAPTSVVVNDERWFPLWKDDLLVGSLKGAIHRVRRNGTDIRYVERMPVGVRRVRDVAQMPDGRMALLGADGSVHFLSRSYRHCDEQSIGQGSVYSADCEEMAALVVDHLGVSPAVKMILDPESLSLSERPGANMGTYTAKLSEAPADEVAVTISPTASIAVDVDGATAGNQRTLTFTAQNWSTPRTVAVAALPDDDATVRSATLTHSVPVLGNVGEVSVTVADDDRGVVLVDAVPDTSRRDPGPLVLHEARGHPSNVLRYAVSLSAQPTGNVAVAVAADVSLVSVAPTALTFTRRNWATRQTLTAKAVEDADPIGESASISHMANGGGYSDVDGLLRVELVDDDSLIIDYDADNDGLIEISTLAQLNAVRWDLRGAGAPSLANEASYEAAFPSRGSGMGCPTVGSAAVCSGYELAADLDFDTDGDGATWSGSPPASDSGDAYHNGGSGWSPIGDSFLPFRAVFDGNGHVIRNLFVNSTDRIQGLFGVLEGASISRLGVENARVVSTSNRIGLLAGRVVEGARVAAVWTTGAVEGATRVGGLLGLAGRNVSVVASYSTAAVAATSEIGLGAGLVGWNQVRAAVAASYATGAVTGGVIQHGIANGPGAVASSYWNSATIPDDGDSTSPEGRTAEQLQAPTSATGIYAGWDALDLNSDGEAESPWDFGTSSDYPALAIGYPVPAVGANNAGGLVEVTEDLLSGAQLYAAHCRACHSVDPEERGVGPHLADIVGRRIGRLGGWMFSSALQSLGGTWTRERLARFLAAPEEFAPGTTMGSQGLSTAEANAIAAHLADRGK